VTEEPPNPELPIPGEDEGMAFNEVMENEMRMSTTAAEAKAKASYRSKVASSRLTTA
jgi:hypothetical protein